MFQKGTHETILYIILLELGAKCLICLAYYLIFPVLNNVFADTPHSLFHILIDILFKFLEILHGKF